jgi:homopolymeric O-antigen transport system permease protein
VPVLESEVDQTHETAQMLVTKIEPSRGWIALDLKALWEYRELLYFLIWRDVKVKYKQTIIGAGWAILQPLVTMVVFTLVFENIANVPSDNIPYPIFAYTALLPWNLFSGGLNRATTSLVAQSNLISKIYFPRMIIPISATLAGIVDFAIAFLILLCMMFWYGIVPTAAVVSLPLFITIDLIAALSVGLWLAALNVRYRDVGQAIPFLVQIWMFASPVAYPVSALSGKYRVLYSLNPVVGVIEGFRWAILGKATPDFVVIAVGAVTMTALLFTGIVYFKRTERTFADLI